jgi:hypothetical protein
MRTPQQVNDYLDAEYERMQREGFDSAGDHVGATVAIGAILLLRLGMFLGFCVIVYLIGSALVN